MNRIALTLFACAGLALSDVAAQESEAIAQSSRLPLARTVYVTDIDASPESDDPGTGGGFEISTYFQTKLTSPEALSACVAQVEGSAAQWATGLGLNRTFKDSTAASLMLHYIKPDLPGMFSVSYEVSQGARAKVAVDFYGLDGARHPPEYAIELNNAYLVAELQDALDVAMSCQPETKP